MLISVIGLFAFVGPVLAYSEPASITIQVQPSSTGTVDSFFSQQPVVMVQDENGNPVPGVIVTVFRSGGLGVIKGNTTATTGSDGLAAFTNLQYTKTNNFSVSFIYNGGSPVASNSMKLGPGAVSPSKSSVSASPDSVVADGKSVSNIKITGQDQYGNPVPGASVKISLTGDGNSLSQFDATDDNGQTTCTMSSTVAEQKDILVKINNVSVSRDASVYFIPGDVAKLIVSANSPVTVNDLSNVTITAKDKFDNVRTNDNSTSVTLSVDNGGSLSSALVTLSGGVAVASIAKREPGTVNFTASVGSITAASKIIFASSDTTSPSIISQYPLTGASNVFVDVQPYVNFSKTMDATTFTSDNMQLRRFSDDIAIPSAIVMANGSKRAILQPSFNLDANTKYYICQFRS